MSRGAGLGVHGLHDTVLVGAAPPGAAEKVAARSYIGIYTYATHFRVALQNNHSHVIKQCPIKAYTVVAQ